MSSINPHYDISLENKQISRETELVEVNNNNIINKDSGYSHLNSNENEETVISTEYTENSGNSKDLSELKEQFNNSEIINKPLVVKKISKSEIQYRKGNLYTFFYDSYGRPKIVIGPDCKYH